MKVFNVLLGLVLSLLIALIFGSILFKYFTKLSPIENLNIIKFGSISGKSISIGAIPCIGLFYLFLNKKNYDAARGVILSFIVISLFVIFR